MSAPDATQLPWAPIYTVTRSGKPERTLYGIVYVWAEDRSLYANAGRSLLRIGDTRFSLWSRSLLKPWQFMTVYPVIKEAYPTLTDEHLALMASSHSGDARQMGLLTEILDIGGLSKDALQCPACKAMRSDSQAGADALNHPCSGKHLAHLLYLKAKKLPAENYLHPETEPYRILRELLGYLINKDDFELTVDGCGMPNPALSAVEMAQLYHALVTPMSRDIICQSPDEVTDALMAWDAVSALMQKHPHLVGGENRLDTRLMQGDWQAKPFSVVAKEGADGLLCMGLGPNELHKDGLGIYIKLSSGYEPAYLEVIAFELLRQLGLLAPEKVKTADSGVVETVFHFQLDAAAAGTAS